MDLRDSNKSPVSFEIMRIPHKKTKMRTTSPTFLVTLLNLLAVTISGQDTEVSQNVIHCAAMVDDTIHPTFTLTLYFFQPLYIGASRS
jgi:hypothetical protein